MTGRDDQDSAEMKLSLRRVLSRLTTIALTATAVSPAAAAAPAKPAPVQAEDERERELEELEGDARIDPGPIEPEDAALALGRGLALALGEMRPLAATHLVATWTLSPDPLRRHAVGVALEWMFPLVGDALVIDQLARDDDPSIRCAAARAAWIRRAAGGDLGVLDRLSDDPDPQVRAIALAARSG